MKNKISCIIPAYNEGSRIGNVLKVVQKHPLVGEMIVINDGSKDNTLQAIKSFRSKKIKLIDFKVNHGKTFGVMTALKKSKSNIVLLLDADLANLKTKNLTDLISPVLNKEADMTISIKENSLWIFKKLRIDFVSGERVFNKNIIWDLNVLKKLQNFGLESFLNSIVIREKYKIKIVPWAEVSHARKSDKVGVIRGFLGDFKMVIQIIKTIGISGIISQILGLRRLKVN
jgi:glycosyltransferase involved in cell wall biosynthesis